MARIIGRYLLFSKCIPLNKWWKAKENAENYSILNKPGTFNVFRRHMGQQQLVENGPTVLIMRKNPNSERRTYIHE